ncbi:MAG: hypothetical protein J7K94_04295 [Dehalococcoidia bacterium]|nr:hypothetical protein [Dehalococcoidia bacterium]
MRTGRIIGIVLLGIILLLKLISFGIYSLGTPLGVILLIGLIFLIIWKPKAKVRNDEAKQVEIFTDQVSEFDGTQPLHSPEDMSLLFEQVARQLKPRYCEKCGAQLEVRKVEEKGFDKDTGYPKYDAIIACPQATLYETSVLSKPLVTYKGPLNKHTTDRISLIIHPED